MAAKTRIKILTTGATTTAPTNLKTGELAYSYVADNGSNNGDRLYIGASAEDAGTGFVTSVAVIGGKYFTDMMDHAKGSLQANSALITNTDSKLEQLKVDDLDLNGSTITNTVTNGSIVLSPNGTGVVNVPSGYKNRTGFGNDSLVTKEYVDALTPSGVATLTGTETLTNKTLTSPIVSGLSLSDSSIVFEGTTADDFETTLTVTDPTADRTITFKDGTGTVAFTTDIPANVSDLTNDSGYITGYTVTSADVTAHEGDLSIGGSQLDDTSVANAKLANDSVTVGTTEIDLGTSATDIDGLTSLDVDNITIDGNDISTTNTDGNLTLSPNGEGTVTLPASYETRTGLGANSVVPKSYVDAIAEGLHVHASVKAATTQDLATESGDTVGYLNGTNGVGATLTLSTGISTLDGYTLVDGDRILIKDESDQENNGIYIRTSSTVFTRASDFDTSDEVASGDFLFVENGTVNGSNGYVQTETTSTIGTDDIIFEQFSGAGQIDAGNGLTKSGNTINVVGTADRITANADSIDIASTYVGQNTITTLGTITTGVWNGTTVGVQYGGTGLTTVTDNGVLYGDATNALDVTAASTADGSILQADSGGAPAFSNIIDGGDY